MADSLFIVWRNEQDQYVKLIDLEQRDVIFKVRDTFKPVLAGRQPIMATSEVRQSGYSQVSEKRDTATVVGTFMVKGLTADSALARVESLLAQANSASRDIFVWWKPEGATYPSLYPIIGPASATVNYTWAQFYSGFIQIECSWPAQPWVEEPVMDMSDDFRVRQLDDSAGVTNLVTNPSFEIDTAGWVLQAGGETLSRVTSEFLFGSAALQVTTLATASSGARMTTNVDAAIGDRLYASAWVKGTGSVFIGIAERTATDVFIAQSSSTPLTLTGTWQQITIQRTVTTGPKARVLIANSPASAVTFYIDGVLFVNSSLSPSYFDGSLTTGRWTGTAHASTSVRLAESKLSDYTTSVAPTSMTQGALELNTQGLTNTAKVAHLGRRPWRDGWVTVKGKAKTGATETSLSVTPGLRYTPADGRYFYATLNATGLAVREWDGVTGQLRASTAQAMPAVGVDHWIRIRADGTSVTAEYWATLPNTMGAPTSTITYTNAANLRAGYPLLCSYGMPVAAGNVSVLAAWDVRPYTYRLLNTPTTQVLSQLPGTAPAAVDIELTAATSDSDYARHLLLGWRRAKAGELIGGVIGGATVHSTLLLPGETGTVSSGSTTTLVVTDGAKYRGASGQAMGYPTLTTEGDTRALWYFDPTAYAADDFSSTTSFAVFVRYWRDTTIVAPRLRGALVTIADTGADGRPLPEFGTTGRYLPTQGAAGVRTTYLGTLTTETRGIAALIVKLSWGAGSAAATAFAVDEVYFVPLASLAVGATGKDRDDGTYTAAMGPTGPGYVRRVRYDLSGFLSTTAGGESLLLIPAPFPLNMGGAQILMPTDPEGVELLVRPSVGVPDDPVTTNLDVLAHNLTVHARVTPRHYFVSA